MFIWRSGIYLSYNCFAYLGRLSYSVLAKTLLKFLEGKGKTVLKGSGFGSLRGGVF